MRQRSIADITFSWPRLTWPAIGRTPGGAVVAEDVRDLQSGASHRAPASGSAARPPGRSGVSRSSGLITARMRLGGDVGIERGRVELGVAEQDLDDADVDVLLQQMRGEAVAQRVRRHPLRRSRRLARRHGRRD